MRTEPFPSRRRRAVAALDRGRFLPQKWVDGGLTDSLPVLPVGRTVTVSPFSGRLDISPRDTGQLPVYVSIAKQDLAVSHGAAWRLQASPRIFHAPPKLGEPIHNFLHKLHLLSGIFFVCFFLTLYIVPPACGPQHLWTERVKSDSLIPVYRETRSVASVLSRVHTLGRISGPF